MQHLTPFPVKQISDVPANWVWNNILFRLCIKTLLRLAGCQIFVQLVKQTSCQLPCNYFNLVQFAASCGWGHHLQILGFGDKNSWICCTANAAYLTNWTWTMCKTELSVCLPTHDSHNECLSSSSFSILCLLATKSRSLGAEAAAYIMNHTSPCPS